MAKNTLTREQLLDLVAEFNKNPIRGEEKGPEMNDRDWFIDMLKNLDPMIIPDLLNGLAKRNRLEVGADKTDRLMLSWEEVVEMKNNGVDFGSHGCSHRILTLLDESEIEKELVESRRKIEEKLHCGIDIFAYPNGDYDNRIVELAKRAGYRCALAVGAETKPDDSERLFALRRINVHEGASVSPRGEFSRAMFSLHIMRNT